MKRDALHDRLSRLLGRLTPPRAIAKDSQAQAEEVRHLLSTINAHAPNDDYHDWWDRFETQLLDNHQTRAWPTVFEVRKAAEAVKPKGEKADTFGFVLDWWQKMGKPHPTLNTPEITQRMVNEGHIATIREARRLGFFCNREQFEIAKSQRPSREEWAHHVSVMARLKDISEAEADAIERAETYHGGAA